MSNSQFLMPSSVVQLGQFGDGMPVVELESHFHREPEMPALSPQMRTNLDLGTQTPLASDRADTDKVEVAEWWENARGNTRMLARVTSR